MRHLLFCGDDLWVQRTPEGPACFFDAAPARFALSEPLPSAPELRVADAGGEPPAPDAERIGLRALFDLVSPEISAQAGLGRQLLHWRRAHRFCGACGTPLLRHPVERAMACPACGHTAYPRINPVVITRVRRGDSLLLVHKAGGALPFWSLVAGFVEAHETLESAVAREIAEEVGLRVTDIRYAASQPWPFPNNLMLGFTAEYAGGEITPDGAEIDEAGWFARDNLPPIPARVSIARRLIDAFFAAH
jgi:NAD+ diphosphatase